MQADHYAQAVCKKQLAGLCSAIGWNAAHSSSMEVLYHLMVSYIRKMGSEAMKTAEYFNRSQVTLTDMEAAFRKLDVSLPQLEDYILFSQSKLPPGEKVPSFPREGDINLNFLKPGSQEVVHRKIHIHDYFPPMYPELEEMESPTASKYEQDTQSLAAAESLEAKSEVGASLRDLSSVMMTASGLISPAREGRLPESRAVILPEPSPVAVAPPSPPRPSQPRPPPAKKEAAKPRKVTATAPPPPQPTPPPPLPPPSLQPPPPPSQQSAIDKEPTEVDSASSCNKLSIFQKRTPSTPTTTSSSSGDRKKSRSPHKIKVKEVDVPKPSKPKPPKPRQKHIKMEPELPLFEFSAMRPVSQVTLKSAVPKVEPVPEVKASSSSSLAEKASAPEARVKIKPKKRKSVEKEQKSRHEKPKHSHSSSSKAEPPVIAKLVIKKEEKKVVNVIPSLDKSESHKKRDKKEKEKRDSERKRKIEETVAQAPIVTIKEILPPPPKKPKKEKSSRKEESTSSAVAAASVPVAAPSLAKPKVGAVGGTITTQTVGYYIDDDGNQIWICPACGKQDDGSPMIGCDECDDWYHWLCVGIQQEPEESQNWFCQRCVAKKRF